MTRIRTIRKTFVRPWRLTLTVVAGLALAAIPGLRHASHAEGITQGSELAVPGLRAKVTVKRDARGIPYIVAANEHDLYLAQGFVTASDRLWQMDLLRRTARGELAEILGRSVLEQDEQMRVLGFGSLADGLVDRVSPRLRSALVAYADGVNALIAARSESGLPAEFGILDYKPKPWRPSDSLVIGKIFALDLSLSWPTDLMRASFASLPSERRAELFREDSPLDVVLVGGEAPSKAGLSEGKSPVHPGRTGELLRNVPDPEGRSATVGVFPPRSSAAGVTLGSVSGAGDLPGSETAGGATAGSVTAAATVEARARGDKIRCALERVGLYAASLAASNNWVVEGKRSVTGKPLLASDPHLAPSAPSIWYLAHLSAPGVRVAGVTPPGAVGIVIGHNERIAWGVTNLMADVQDLYAERFDPSGKYATPSGTREAEVRKEHFLVKSDKPDAKEPEVVERDMVATRHGPIVFEAGGQRYALRWTALDPDACELSAFFDLDRASNWKEFTAALRGFAGPPLNFVYADTSGHIGYYGAGRIPVRTSGDGTVPYDGTTGASEWSGYVSFDELPHLLDPPSGVIVTANNRVVGSRYPHLITRAWGSPYRARRIWDLLAAKPKLSSDDFQSIQADTYSHADALFARAVIEVARRQQSDNSQQSARDQRSARLGGQTNQKGTAGSKRAAGPDTEEAKRESGGRDGRQGTVGHGEEAAKAEATNPEKAPGSEWASMVKAFNGWDGRASADSRALPLAVAMRRVFARKILDSALGAERAKGYQWSNSDTLIDEIVTSRPAAWLPKEYGSWPELFLACWTEGRAALARRAGEDETKWTWGRVQDPVLFPHPLAEVPEVGARFAIDPLPQEAMGSTWTVNAGNFVSMRFIGDASDWDRSRQGIALGESGDPSSPHWKDQLAVWRAVKTPAFPFSRAAVERAAAETQILVPGAVRRTDGSAGQPTSKGAE